MDLLYFGLNALHQHLLFRAFMEKRIEDQADEQRDEDDREAKIMQSDRLIKKYQEDSGWAYKKFAGTNRTFGVQLFEFVMCADNDS